MNKTICRWSALAISTLVGAAVLAPLGGTAHAATGTPVHFYVASKNGAPAALYNRSTGARVSPAAAAVRDLRASQDGTRLVDLEAALDANGNQVQSIRVYDVSGHPLSTVTSLLSSTGADLRWPNISPDGTVVVWSEFDAGVGTLFSKNLVTGAITTLGANLDQAVFASTTRLIVRDPNGLGYWMPVSGGTPTQITSFPVEAVGMTVSPDGTKVAWEHELGTSPATADIYVAALSVTNAGVSLGSPASWTKIATGKDNYAPAFSRDGTQVYFIHADNETIGYGQVMRAPANGSSAPVVVDGTDFVKVITQAVGELPAAPVTPLATPVPAAATLAGTAATLRWAKPSDARVSQILIERYLGATRQFATFVALPATSYRNTGLVIGKTYEYRFTALDRGANKSATATRKLTAAGAAPSHSDPTSGATTRAPFAVRFGPGSPAVKWTVDYRVNSGSTWTRWLTSVTGSSRTFSAAVAGRTYQFRAKAVDAFGNSTTTNAGARTVVPLNQSAATISGGTTVSSTAAWLGSYRKLTRTSSYARISLYGNRFQVIAWRCTGCGSFAIYQGSTRIATVSTYATSTRVRQVVFTKYFSTNGTRTFTIRPLGTSGHPAVLLDGFAMRR